MKIRINVKKPYDVIIKNGILSDIAAYLQEFRGRTAAIITDENVLKLYEPTVRAALENTGFNVISHAFASGEKHKTPEELFGILNFLADKKVTRSDFIIALGGGIVGDMAGFAAGIYLRGIRYIQVPTTFLAAVDSSVGGKTAVNLAVGKNLAGLFYQPESVICDPETFRTLDDVTFLDGVSEAVKHGFICDEMFFRLLSGKTRAQYMKNIEKIVMRNVEIKGEIVAADEFENGQRQLLNFGHTAGHAIEKATNHAVSHGQAVAAGMIIMSRAAYKKNYCERDYSREIEAAFAGFSQVIDLNYSAKKLFDIALSDKKRSGGKINIIIPESAGKCVIKQINTEELLEIFELGLEKNRDGC
jgi:3-dehydroquinate synthase